MLNYSRTNLTRWLFLITLILLGGYSSQIFNRIQAVEIEFSIRSMNWLFFFGCSLAAVVFLILLVITFSPKSNTLIGWVYTGWQILPKNQISAWVLAVISLFGLPLIVYGPLGNSFDTGFERIFFFWIFTLVGITGLKILFPKYNGFQLLFAITLLNTFVYKVFTFFPEISSYPFSIGWSETSRFYYASLFFAKKIYGIDTPPSVLHPTRYLMQSIPFLISGLPLWFHRLWQVLLWLVVTVWSAVVFERRFALQNRPKRLLFIVWFFLFLLIGPIYYHLQIMGIILFWGYDKDRPWKTLLVVVLASAWAGISRVNWFPVPAMLAATLYFFERPKGKQSLLRYLIPPALWGILGVLVAFGAQTLYVIWSGNDPKQFTSSFSSDLLWYRLFPNTTYGLGILLGVLIFSLPMILFIIAEMVRRKNSIHRVRWLGIWAFLLVLFAGGLIVSVKIGGGSNLHNFDAFLLLIGVVCGYLYFGQLAADDSSLEIPRINLGWLVYLSVAILLVLTLQTGLKPEPQNAKKIDRALESIQTLVAEAIANDGEVLFVTQRHLLTFNMIPDVPLIPEYENVFFMEMVMGNNRPYLDQFQAELKAHRFDLIVISRLPKFYKDADKFSWSEEHNVWVERVALPILESYQRVELYNEFGIEILEPAH